MIGNDYINTVYFAGDDIMFDIKNKFGLVIFKGHRLISSDETNMYDSLWKCIRQFPEESPQQYLLPKNMPPYYSRENFDIVIDSLEVQKEHNVDSDDDHIDKIKQLQYKVQEIKAMYTLARKEYNIWKEQYQHKFEIHADDELQNALARFNVIIDNSFIAGMTDSTKYIGEAKDNIRINLRRVFDN